MSDNAWASAWRELRAAQNETMLEGSTVINPQITIHGTTCDIILGEDSNDASFMGGGVGNQGQMTVQSLLADWSGSIPQKAETAVVSGMAGSNTATFQVISTTERNGILYIMIGDNSTQ